MPPKFIISCQDLGHQKNHNCESYDCLIKLADMNILHIHSNLFQDYKIELLKAIIIIIQHIKIKIRQMREIKNRKQNPFVKFPVIKEKSLQGTSVLPNKAVKLERIGQKKNMMILDIAKINKIQKDFATMTKRADRQVQQEPKLKKDEMRQSRLLLLKDKTPALNKKSTNQNLLSNLVLYHPIEESSKKRKVVNIPQSNISVSPNKLRKPMKPLSAQITQCNYSKENVQQLQKIDFVKLFIIEELLCYIYKTTQRNKDEMSGFCKFYNENSDEDVVSIISSILSRPKDYLEAIFYEKLGFYIFLILGTDTELQEQANFLLKSLMGYLHTNNLIILDIMMEIIDIQKLFITSQFHIYNTSRFNEDRRKINSKTDKMGLLAKNNKSSMQIIRSILINCGFDSLKTFVTEILANQQIQMMDKIREVSMMLISLDTILVNSIPHTQKPKPRPPFLGQKQKDTPYTLVLDMDQTLIHYFETNKQGSLLIRPYCQQFLEQMAKHYEIVIFTAAVKQYADSILDTIDKKSLISHRLYRQHTRLEDYVSIKDLSLINRNLAKTIIIDNIASNFKMQPRNGIAISTWTGDPEDLSLYNLIPVMSKLAQSKVNDVRDGLQYLSDYMQSKMKNNQPIDFDQLDLKGI